MLAVLCARPKPWTLNALSFSHGGPQNRLVISSCSSSSVSFFNTVVVDQRRRTHSSGCRLGSIGVGTASIWHGILPSSSSSSSSGGDCRLKPLTFHHHDNNSNNNNNNNKGEGSWNVAWDVRPARWLHSSDSAWLLFGVCSCHDAPFDCCDGNHEVTTIDDQVLDVDDHSVQEIKSDVQQDTRRSSPDYRVTGVLADGRCLFRALAHAACLRSGEEAPDETHQRELADSLRGKVVEELLKRRKESEWYIDGDFDKYVMSIQNPNAWGGEPELIMAAHVLQTPVSVFMRSTSSGELVNIMNYGEEYGKSKNPINMLFHRYGHYDLLETLSGQSLQNVGT